LANGELLHPIHQNLIVLSRQYHDDTDRNKTGSVMVECQSFRQGCVGCCVNMRWSPERVSAYLAGNTRVFSMISSDHRLRLSDLARIHWKRGGWRDHLLVSVLAPVTLGLTAWLWMRFHGSCCFAGIIDPVTGRGGCLIHPARVGLPDLRRHAFPGLVLLGCNRSLRCPQLDRVPLDLSSDLINTSKEGFSSLRRMGRKPLKRGLHGSGAQAHSPD
jgi:hypothetical protein